MSYEPREILRHILAEVEFLVEVRATLLPREAAAKSAVARNPPVRGGEALAPNSGLKQPSRLALLARNPQQHCTVMVLSVGLAPAAAKAPARCLT